MPDRAGGTVHHHQRPALAGYENEEAVVALTAEQVRATRFTERKWREGYDMGDVDAFLLRVQAALDAVAGGRVPPLRADDVLNARFQATKFRTGYDQDEVDDLLDQVTATLRAAEDRR